VALISSKSRDHSLRDRDLVSHSEIRTAGISLVLIGRTGLDTTISIPNPTLSLTYNVSMTFVAEEDMNKQIRPSSARAPATGRVWRMLLATS